MLNIVRMTTNHIKDVHRIEAETFAIPWSEKSFIDEITKNKMAIYVVAIKDEKLVGYGGMWHVINEGHITNIAIQKDYRNMGIGDAIVKELILLAIQKEMIGITLEVRKSNELAQNIYKKNGFFMDGIRKEYYDDNGEDAIIMWKSIT